MGAEMPWTRAGAAAAVVARTPAMMAVVFMTKGGEAVLGMSVWNECNTSSSVLSVEDLLI